MEEATLREVVETLAAIERAPSSSGERRAADWLADRLRRAGCDVSVEEEAAWGGYLQVAAALGLLASAGAALSLRGRRGAGALCAAAAAAAPQWWLGLAGPALTVVGSTAGRRGVVRAGLLTTLTATAIVLEIASNRPVPGANDNLSGVAALVALAELTPPPGVRLLLVSCG